MTDRVLDCILQSDIELTSYGETVYFEPYSYQLVSLRTQEFKELNKLINNKSESFYSSLIDIVVTFGDKGKLLKPYYKSTGDLSFKYENLNKQSNEQPYQFGFSSPSVSFVAPPPVSFAAPPVRFSVPPPTPVSQPRPQYRQQTRPFINPKVRPSVSSIRPSVPQPQQPALPPSTPGQYPSIVGDPQQYLHDTSIEIQQTLGDIDKTLKNVTLPKATSSNPSYSGQSSIGPSSSVQQGSFSSKSNPVNIKIVDSSCEISPDLIALWTSSKKLEYEDNESLDSEPI